MAQIIETIHHVIHTIMFSFAMQAHYSTASILAYITQSDRINQKQAGSCLFSHTQCQTNFYSWFLQLVSRYKMIIIVIITRNNGYDSNSNIYLKKQNTHSQGITNIMNQMGPNVMFEII